MRNGWLIALPLILLGLCIFWRPFPDAVATKVLSTRTLSQPQIVNLTVAVRHLDGLVLQPGERFSFNRAVGPRTTARGYEPAPSYLAGESPQTVGGGICLLSSALYQVALESGLRIEQRVPHLRTIHSVPPGLDATVWYGGADLSFINTTRHPLHVRATLKPGSLTLALEGQKTLPSQPIQRIVRRLNARDVTITVVRAGQVVSRDLYRIAP